MAYWHLNVVLEGIRHGIKSVFLMAQGKVFHNTGPLYEIAYLHISFLICGIGSDDDIVIFMVFILNSQ